MQVEVICLPKLLDPARVAGTSAVVFDVLRATTTMTAALAAGVSAIHAFANNAAALAAARAFGAGAVTVGELHAVKAPDFDLGNSPGVFTREKYAGKTLFMSTTNGTKALAAVRELKPASIAAAALVNRSAVARVLAAAGRPVLLLASGTDGDLSMEDLLGAGAVIDALRPLVDITLHGDTARLAFTAFEACKDDLHIALRETAGGLNNRAAGNDADIALAARLDVFDLVGVVAADALVVTAVHV